LSCSTAESIGERVAFVFRGDIGGFGAGSDFTWNIQTGFGFKFARQWAFLAEYRVMDTDYDKGEGADRFVYDGREHGLLLGVVFAF
jgi:hypothetical protein